MSVQLNITLDATCEEQVKEARDILNRITGDVVTHSGAEAHVILETKPEATVVETKAHHNAQGHHQSQVETKTLEEEVANMPEEDLIPAGVAAGIDLDTEILPWDHRIHTPAKTKKKDGTWKLLRGIDPALVAQVKAELRLTMQAKPLEVATIQTPAVTPAEAEELEPVVDALAQVFINNPLSGATEEIVEEGVTAAITFPAFLQKTTDRYSVENFGPAYKVAVDATLAEMGIPSVGLVGQRPELLPEIDTQLDALWAGVNA